MKHLSKIAIVAIAFLLIGCPEKVNQTIKKLSDNVTTPVYTPFNLPQSSIGLPSIFVGNENSIENVCFKGSSATEEFEATDSLRIVVNQDTKITSSMQLKLEKELINAGLSAEIAKSTSRKISVEVEGLSIKKLSKISEVIPDFNSAACNTQSLNYYVNNRTIITGALKAEKYIVKTEAGLTNELKTKLDAVIDTLNIKLKLAFNRVVNASGNFEYTATDVFFGALTTKLAVVECKTEVDKVEIMTGGLYEKDLCSNFKARLKRSIMSSDFTVEIYPENNPRIGSGQIDVIADKVTDVLVNDVTLAAVTIDQIGESDQFNIDLSIYIVGINAEEIID